MSYCYNNNVSNCYTICKEVTIVLIAVKTSTTVTKVHLMREITDFSIHLSRRVYSFAFENFEEKNEKVKNDKKRRDRKKMRIFEFRNRIRIFEYPLTSLIHIDKSRYFLPIHRYVLNDQSMTALARWATHDYRRTSSLTEMLKKLRWPPLHQRRIDTHLVMMFKITL